MWVSFLKEKGFDVVLTVINERRRQRGADSYEWLETVKVVVVKSENHVPKTDDGF